MDCGLWSHDKLTELPVVLHPESILHEHNSVFDHQHVEEEDEVREIVRDEPQPDVAGMLVVVEELSEGNGSGIVNKAKRDQRQPG